MVSSAAILSQISPHAQADPFCTNVNPATIASASRWQIHSLFPKRSGCLSHCSLPVYERINLTAPITPDGSSESPALKGRQVV
jgi:hypothetical protein